MLHMIWNPLDPLGSLSQALQDAVAAIVGLFEQFIAIPMSLDGVPFVASLYGNALGVYPYLAMLVVALTFVAAIFFVRGRVSFAQAIIVALATAVLGPLWFQGFSQVQILGDQLALAFNLNKHVETSDGINVVTLLFPQLQIQNVVMSTLTFAPLLFFMYTLFGIFVSYSFWAVVVKFLGLILLSLLALGDKARKVFSFLMAIGIVAVLIGKAFAVLFISIGQGLSTITTMFAPGFIQGFILVGSILAAILIQPVLIYLMYKGVSPVIGKVAAAVRGTVKTLGDKRSGQAAGALSRANQMSMQGRAQAIPYNSAPAEQHYVRRAAEVATAMAVAKGAAMLAAKAASNVHPVAKVAFVASSVAMKALPRRTSNASRK